MDRRYGKFNPKRRVRRGCTPEELQRLAAMVSYGGNPHHKRNPGDFGLIPPAEPRLGKTLCDEVAVFSRRQALLLRREGIRRGMISERQNNGFPQNIWSVIEMDNGELRPLEAQLENSLLGRYHGYPLQVADPMFVYILMEWRRSS